MACNFSKGIISSLNQFLGCLNASLGNMLSGTHVHDVAEDSAKMLRRDAHMIGQLLNGQIRVIMLIDIFKSTRNVLVGVFRLCECKPMEFKEELIDQCRTDINSV